MTNKEEKISQIMSFVRSHPESFASRTVMRRFGGNIDFEAGEEFYVNLESNMKGTNVDGLEIDLCYDMIK